MKSKNFYKTFNIRFAGINYGRHTFDFTINDAFMKFYDEFFESDLNINLKFSIEKQTETFFSLFFDFDGYLICNCDRCLNQFKLPLKQLHKMFLKVDSNKIDAEDDDIAYVSANDFEYNIADNVHDFILMMIPFSLNCEMAGLSCDQEMIDKLKNLSSNNLKIKEKLEIKKQNLN